MRSDGAGYAIPALCAAAQDDYSRPYPTFALALSLFDDPAWEALSLSDRCATGGW